MLRVKELQALLAGEMQAEKYIRNIMVITLDGGILACGHRPHDGSDLSLENSGVREAPKVSETSLERLQTLVAVLVSLYGEYGAFGANFHSMIVDCEKGRAAVGALGSGALVLCIWATPTAPIGALQKKFEVLYNNLSEVLKDLY